MRIGKSVPFKGKYISRHFHVSCAFAMFRKARVATSIVTRSDDLGGFDEINNDEKSYIARLIETEVSIRNVEAISPPIPNNKQKQKSSLESRNFASLNVMFANADQLTSSKMSELQKHIENEKPMTVAICEMKPKNARDGCLPTRDKTTWWRPITLWVFLPKSHADQQFRSK